MVANASHEFEVEVRPDLGRGPSRLDGSFDAAHGVVDDGERVAKVGQFDGLLDLASWGHHHIGGQQCEGGVAQRVDAREREPVDAETSGLDPGVAQYPDDCCDEPVTGAGHAVTGTDDVEPLGDLDSVDGGEVGREVLAPSTFEQHGGSAVDDQ